MNVSPLPKVLPAKTPNEEQKTPAGDLIRRVGLLMEDDHYPPLYPVRVNLHVPFHIRNQRP